MYDVVRDVISLRDIGEFVQSTFMLLGLLIIIYISIQGKEKTLFSMVTVLTFAFALISQYQANLVYVIISIYFIYILMHYWKNYKLLPTRNKLIVFTGFFMLFWANLLYIFMPFHQYFYVGGHIAELLGYLMLVINLIMVFKRK